MTGHPGAARSPGSKSRQRRRLTATQPRDASAEGSADIPTRCELPQASAELGTAGLLPPLPRPLL